MPTPEEIRAQNDKFLAGLNSPPERLASDEMNNYIRCQLETAKQFKEQRRKLLHGPEDSGTQRDSDS